jgi:hypothetical protein
MQVRGWFTFSPGIMKCASQTDGRDPLEAELNDLERGRGEFGIAAPATE